MPKVSVWLTSYNHGKFIGESIESILAQTYEDFELFITDDCSTDSSWEIITQYVQKDARIHATRHSYNQGGSGLKNRLNELNGEYVAIAHCDDAWLPDKLEKQVKILDEHPNVAACFTWVNVVDDDGKLLTDEGHQYHHVFEQFNRSRYEWLNYFFYNGNCLCHPSLLIRKKAYTEMNIFAEGLHAYPDFCKWIRLCKQADIHVVQDRLTNFRVHGDASNTSGENLENIKRGYIEGYLLLKEYLSLIGSGEFLKVFPEAERYVVNGEICEKYAFAQILLDNYQNSYKLLGFELLYELFQNVESEQKILKLYNYTRKMYNTDKQKYDVFGTIPDTRCLEVNIFLNGPQGYTENNRISTTVFIQHTGAFAVKIDLSNYPQEMLGNLRVDLDERKYRRFRIIKCTCNNVKWDIVPINGCQQNEWDVFYTTDPQYEMRKLTNGLLCIEGYVEEIPYGEVENHFGGIVQQRDMYQQQVSELVREIDRVKNTIVWKMRNKISQWIGSRG